MASDEPVSEFPPPSSIIFLFKIKKIKVKLHLATIISIPGHLDVYCSQITCNKPKAKQVNTVKTLFVWLWF